MKQSVYLILTLLLIIGCKPDEARRPLINNSGTVNNASIRRNKTLNEAEYTRIQALINSSEKRIYTSENGFWYFYNSQLKSETKTPKFGDQVYFIYNVKNLNNELIYSKKELSPQSYYIDQQELFSGLREGLKLMKENETITFIFPSQKAYGYYGDNNLIGRNTPLICEVSLLKHQIN